MSTSASTALSVIKANTNSATADEAIAYLTDSSIIDIIKHASDVTDLTWLKHIYTHYGKKLNLKKEWETVCFSDPINPETLHSKSGVIMPNKITLLTYYATLPNEGYDQFLKFLLLEVKLNLEVMKSTLKKDNCGYYISEDYILSWAMQGALQILPHQSQHKFTPEIFLDRTLPKIFLLLNQGCYLNSPLELDDLETVFKECIRKKQIDESWEIVYKSFQNILKAARALLYFAKLTRNHTSEEKDEIAILFTVLKNGINGRFAAENMTALQYAIKNNHMELTMQLRNAGAHNELQYFSGFSFAIDAINSAASAPTSVTADLSSTKSLVFSNQTISSNNYNAQGLRKRRNNKNTPID